MNRLERLTGIILALQRKRLTGAEMTERFEVSRRTILRDIDALCQMGVPVVAMPGATGGYEIADGYWLRPVQLAADEVSILLLALRSLDQSTGSTFGVARGTAEEKLRAALDHKNVELADESLESIHFAASGDKTLLRHLHLLRAAIAACEWIEVEYRSLRREASHLLFPIRLVVTNAVWYLRAVSHEAVEMRDYRLDRMASATLSDAPADADAVVEKAGQAGISYDDPSHPEVVIRITGRGVLEARADPDLARVLHELGEGIAIVRQRCPPSDLPFWARKVLAYGSRATVESPPELRSMVIAEFSASLVRYESDANPA